MTAQKNECPVAAGHVAEQNNHNINFPIFTHNSKDEKSVISYFAIADQRSIQKISAAIEIYPCRELLIDSNVKTKAAKLGDKFPQIKELTDKLIEGITFPVALAAPVLVGIMFTAAALARLKSLCGVSSILWSFVYA